MPIIVGLIVVAVILIFNLVIDWDIRRLKKNLLYKDDTESK
jgi:hypothetical protein